MVTLEYTPDLENITIEACAQLPVNATKREVAAVYISLCSDDLPVFNSLLVTIYPDTPHLDAVPPEAAHVFSLNTHTLLAVFAGKKYKPVACKIRPIETELPSCFCITCDIKGDPLHDLLQLNL